MPTFERLARFDREFRRLPRELQRAFLAMLPMFITALRQTPPVFSVALRIRRVQGSTGIWGITFAPDGRATFQYGAEILKRGTAHHLAASRESRRPERAVADLGAGWTPPPAS